MSLEHALLDRLEKRSLQIEQQKNEIYGLRQLVNEKMTINAQLSEQITAAWLEREQMQNQISELRTERDRILEVSKGLVPKSALKQAVQEAAELHSEVAKLRAEVPLESTREGLKNAVAKLQEVNAQLDSAKGEAEEWLKQCHAARRQRDEVKAEARKETQRLSDLCAELQSKYESLLAAQNTVKADVAMVYQIADKLGRNQAESIPEFIERQALRVAALESQAGKIGYVAKGEHEEAVTAARENGIHKGESLSGFIWRQCEGLRKSQAENAPLTKLFVVLCKQRGNLNEEIIYRAVDEASDAIRKLTA
jgi:chromosome segregation ATPase